MSFPTLFPIEVRVSAADDIALSTGYGRENGWVAVHQYKGAPYHDYFQGVEAIMDELRRPPALGQAALPDGDDAARALSRMGRLRRQRARLDPDGTFRNDYLDRVLGPIPT